MWGANKFDEGRKPLPNIKQDFQYLLYIAQ